MEKPEILSPEGGASLARCGMKGEHYRMSRLEIGVTFSSTDYNKQSRSCRLRQTQVIGFAAVAPGQVSTPGALLHNRV
jgi:hypothetical protein